jgi:cytochrome c553
MNHLPTFGIIIAAAMMLTAGPYASAAGDIAAGKAKSAICASCHGTDGVSPQPNFPIIAGQYQDYIVRALKDYKSGERENAIMKGFVANLSEQDMKDLAAYFYSQQGLAAP